MMKVDHEIDHERKLQQIMDEGTEIKRKLKEEEILTETYEADMKVVVNKSNSLFVKKKLYEALMYSYICLFGLFLLLVLPAVCVM
jgi:hypothetical protein